MPRVKITPNPTYHPGHIGSLINLVAPGPMVINQDGSIVVKLTDDQLEAFHRRGGACHKVEILPESDPPSAVADSGPAAEPKSDTAEQPGVEADIQEVQTKIETPTMWQTPAHYVADARKRGLDDQQIINALVNAGWKESQAIDVVMNDEMPPAA